MKTVIGISRIIVAALVCAAGFQSSQAQTASTIASNFNGTKILSGRYLWFNAHFTSVSFSGAAATAPEVILYVSNSKVTFTASGTPYTVLMPDSEIRFSSTATTATGSFGTDKWIITVPKSGAGNPFLGGMMWQVPAAGLPGGINPVSWSAQFTSSVGTVTEVQWQWSAAVYTSAPTSPNQLGVLWVDGARQSGTPMNNLAYVVGGARGGGGSNYTGSNSATGKATNIAVINPLPTGTLAISQNLWLQGVRIPVGYNIRR